MEHILSSQLIISLFIILILYNQKNSLKFTSEKVLFYYLVLLMVRSVVDLIATNIDYLIKFPYLVYINQSTYFLDGLFIYLYVKVLKNETVYTKKTLLLLAPFLIFFSFTIKLMYSADIEILRNYILELESTNTVREWDSTGTVFFVLVIIYNIILYIHSLLIFKTNSEALKKTISVKHDLTFKWQKMFLSSWFFLYLLPFVITLLTVYFNSENRANFELLFSVSTLLLTFIFGLKKIKIRYEELSMSNEEFSFKQLVKSQNKYGTLKLDDSRAEQLKKDIEGLIENKEILSDLDLNLSSFSEKLNEKEYIVSQVINSLYNKSFQDFINTHRIEYAKNILTQEPDNKIIHVALDCGYKSTVTFNRQFKKHVGITPTEYKKNMLEN